MECDECYCLINYGDSYLEYEDCVFCCDECLHDFVDEYAKEYQYE